MSKANVTMTVRSTGNRIGIIDIQGEVTGAAENVLTDAYAKAGADARAVVLNFSGLEYMNSSGIGLLVMLLIRAQRQGQKLLAFGLSEHYQEIFYLTRLNEAIALFADEPEALAALNGAHS
jgi:anti-sigma B factor antagonist